MVKVNKGSELTNKLIRRTKSFPGWLVNTCFERRYQKKWGSKELAVPSKVTLNEIEAFLGRTGISLGDTMLVHSSWKHLSSGHFTPAQLVKLLLSTVGVQGTLAMPAFPPYFMQKPDTIFDVKRTPSGGGMLSDGFRRYPGVKRSINLNHSVCAIGPQAEFLTRDHHKSETSWDQNSPYYRLRDIDNAWIVGLGVGHRLKVATSLHCVESALWKENRYFKKLFREDVCYEYKTVSGETGSHCYKKRSGHIYTPKIAQHFTSDELIEDTIEGLDVYAIRARTLIDKAIELGREGKTMYIWPIPWPWYFGKK